jgi:hypothetical protein
MIEGYFAGLRGGRAYEVLRFLPDGSVSHIITWAVTPEDLRRDWADFVASFDNRRAGRGTYQLEGTSLRFRIVTTHFEFHFDEDNRGEEEGFDSLTDYSGTYSHERLQLEWDTWKRGAPPHQHYKGTFECFRLVDGLE